MNSIYDCRILLVDDSDQLRKMVVDILKKEGFSSVHTASCCADALLYFSQKLPDIVILDVGLPDGDGFSLMQRIRSFSDVPVLFLSARDEDSDRLLGLGLGADDYITKPFLPGELILRLKAVLKRTWFSPRRGVQEDSGVLRLGERTVNFNSGTVLCNGQERYTMTAKEMALLRKLSDNRGNIVTFDALSQAAWGDFYYGYENTLMVHIRRLREKLEENPSEPKWLLTSRGLGYKLAKEP